MEKILDVFGVVESGGSSRGLGSLLLVAWLAGIDALVDTQASEIWEGDLKLADSLGTGYEVLRLAGST